MKTADITRQDRQRVKTSVATNRISHRSTMQMEKSQPEGKRIMPETKFTSFPALSVDPRVGFFYLYRRPMFDYFS